MTWFKVAVTKIPGMISAIGRAALKFQFGVISGCLALALSSAADAKSPLLDAPTAAIALDFWTKLKANEGLESQLLAEDATFSMMGLGGRYSAASMSHLVSACDMVGLYGGEAQDENDPTQYVWAVLECLSDGKTETVPLGLGVREGKITEMEISVLTPVPAPSH